MYIFLILSVLGPRVYGCAIPGAGSVADSAHHPKEAEGFLFAPRDVTPWQFEGKDDTHGIGYSGMEEQAVLKAQRATQSLYGMSGEVGCGEELVVEL